jgi:meiosis induction protein kinase IME2/SME1
MTVVYDSASRAYAPTSNSALCLEDRFEILKEIGDGSFGSVALARVRSAGAQVARRGTLVSGS